MSCESKNQIAFLRQWLAGQLQKDIGEIPDGLVEVALRGAKDIDVRRLGTILDADTYRELNAISSELEKAYRQRQQEPSTNRRKVLTSTCGRVDQDTFLCWAYALLLVHEHLQESLREHVALGMSNNRADDGIENGTVDDILSPSLNSDDWQRMVLSLTDEQREAVRGYINDVWARRALTERPKFSDQNAIATAISTIPPIPIDPGGAYLAMCESCAKGGITPPAVMRRMIDAHFVPFEIGLRNFGGTTIEKVAAVMQGNLTDWSKIRRSILDGEYDAIDQGQKLARKVNYFLIGPPGTGKTTIAREVAIALPWELPDGRRGWGVPFVEFNPTSDMDSSEIGGRATLRGGEIRMDVPPSTQWLQSVQSSISTKPIIHGSIKSSNPERRG